jgi:hypothetical protein
MEKLIIIYFSLKYPSGKFKSMAIQGIILQIKKGPNHIQFFVFYLCRHMFAIHRFRLLKELFEHVDGTMEATLDNRQLQGQLATQLLRWGPSVDAPNSKICQTGGN